MQFSLTVIDWNAIAAISTLLAVLVALFYQPFMNRRRLFVEVGLTTDLSIGEHQMYLSVTNRGAQPIYLTSCGLGYRSTKGKVVQFIGHGVLPKMLSPGESVEFKAEPIVDNLTDIFTLFARDSFGRFWYIAGKAKKKFEEYRQICLDNNPPRPAKGMFMVKRPTRKPKSE